MGCIASLTYMFGVYWLNVLWYVVTGVIYHRSVYRQSIVVSKILMSGQFVNYKPCVTLQDDPDIHILIASNSLQL